MKKYLRKLYLQYVFFIYDLKKYIFGVDYANKMFILLDQRAIVPLIKHAGGKVGKNTNIESPIFFHMVIKDLSNFQIGDNTNISKGCFFDLCDKIEIGNNCTLGMQVMITTHTHFGSTMLGYKYKNINLPVSLKDNVYIGAKSIVINGVCIKNNTLVAAGSLVNKDFDCNCIIGGVPAKKINDIYL